MNYYVVHNSESVAILSSKSSSSSRLSEFVRPNPLQLPHAGEHFTLCFLHVHLILLQSVWQLHLTIFRSSSGAGGKSVSTGISFLRSFSIPIPVAAFQHYNLSTPVFGSIHGGYGILQRLKLVVESGDEYMHIVFVATFSQKLL